MIQSINCRRQKEAEQKSIEEEANKRIEELVAKRVAEELERRKEEIEAEVTKRVEIAKKAMEAQMLEDIEKRKQEQIEEAQRREVSLPLLRIALPPRMERHQPEFEKLFFALSWLVFGPG